MSVSAEEEEENAYIKTFKLALATSIIRTTPSHLTAKEYAIEIANKLRQKEKAWKRKVDVLKNELEEAKKKIVLLTMKNESLSGGFCDTAENTTGADMKDASLSYKTNAGFIASDFESTVGDQYGNKKNILKIDHSMDQLADLSSIMLLDTTKYERMFYICETLQQITNTTLSIWPCQDIGKHYDMLESNLFSISDQFPLYAHSVWLISSTMADYQYQTAKQHIEVAFR